MANHFGLVLRQAGVSLQDWHVLAALRERGGLRLTELAARTSIEISTLSRPVAGMETAGLVSRERDSDDARAIAIHLPAPGDNMAAQIGRAGRRERECQSVSISVIDADTKIKKQQ